MKKFTLKVHDIRVETKDTITLSFKQPGLRKIKYLAGQYLTLSIRINGRKYSRPYSFSSAPSVDTMLKTTVKRVPGGIFSNYLHDNIQIGDSIEVIEPMGDFVHQISDSITSVYFWGVGSGITPLISIIKECLFSHPQRKVVLVYGNKNFDSTIFLDVINHLIEQYRDRIEVWHFHSQYEHNENHHRVISGRINSDFIIDLMKGVNLPHTRHYICGPNDLKNLVKESLSEIDCPLELIHSEDFELVKNPKLFEDIQTQTIVVSHEGKSQEVVVSKGKSVLEAALDAGIDLPYSCQTGSCNTCKAKLKTGQLRMIGLTKERNDLEQGDFLLCCSHPLTDDVSVDI